MIKIIASSVAATTTENGPRAKIGEVEVTLIQVNASNVAGTTPTLDVKLQVSADGTNWKDSGLTVPQILANGSEFTVVSSGQKLVGFVRAVATIGGSAGQTFDYDVYLAGVDYDKQGT